MSLIVSFRAKLKIGMEYSVYLSTGVAALFAGAVQAVEFGGETYKGNIDTTVSYGIATRVEGRDPDLVGLPNGGNAYSVNGDDGNLNFDKGIINNALKLTSELELDFGQYGFFVRGSALYDAEIMGGDREHKELSDEGKDLVGQDISILDAYAWTHFDVGDRVVDARLGNQVLSWGESTFIQNGIGVINPIDVGKIRVPGAELREALLPVPILSASIGATENSSLEAFLQLQWKPVIIDPSGSYFSTSDFAGDGGERVQLGFGAIGEGAFLGVERAAEDNEPDDAGQFGLAYRMFVPDWNDTELGFYYMNYHSRLPIVSANSGSQAGLDAQAQVYTDAGVPPGTNPTVDSIALNAYTETTSYFFEYPEDISLFGVSFNAPVGTTGVVLQGEVSHRKDTPLQIDDVEILFAALSPANSAYNNGQLEGKGIDEQISGYILRDVTQLQVTGTSVFTQIIGASQMALVGEVGFTHVHGMPDKDDLRLESSGTFISGNQTLASAHGPAAGEYEDASHFADANSWGYRLLARFTYDNAIGSINLTPRIAWAQDVEGNSPGPGGNFLEGRTAMTLGLGADYLNQWSGDLSYTRFDGAGRYNLINDRDFVAFNLKYAF